MSIFYKSVKQSCENFKKFCIKICAIVSAHEKCGKKLTFHSSVGSEADRPIWQVKQRYSLFQRSSKKSWIQHSQVAKESARQIWQDKQL